MSSISLKFLPFNISFVFGSRKNVIGARSGLDWIDMAQDRDKWRAFVNTVLNLRVP
jgi:hypothetical protein